MQIEKLALLKVHFCFFVFVYYNYNYYYYYYVNCKRAKDDDDDNEEVFEMFGENERLVHSFVPRNQCHVIYKLCL